ncbi:hypothetical protein D3C76_1194810 [compost metagenome]
MGFGGIEYEALTPHCLRHCPACRFVAVLKQVGVLYGKAGSADNGHIKVVVQNRGHVGHKLPDFRHPFRGIGTGNRQDNGKIAHIQAHHMAGTCRGKGFLGHLDGAGAECHQLISPGRNADRA